MLVKTQNYYHGTQGDLLNLFLSVVLICQVATRHNGFTLRAQACRGSGVPRS